MRFLLATLIILLTAPALAQTGKPPPMQIMSTAFQPNGPIPMRFTCEGANVSPPLNFSDIPAGTKSLALIVDDPDAPDPAAPQRTFVHWVLFNIPTDVENIAEGSIPHDSMVGLNDQKKPGYHGPCPPIGRHRYFFKLYALDAMLTLAQDATKADLEKAMKGHIVAQTDLVGTYEKVRK